MKRQGETKAAPRAADVDAGSCLLCGGVCELEVVRLIVMQAEEEFLRLCNKGGQWRFDFDFVWVYECVFDYVWVYEHMYLHVCVCVYTVYLVFVYVCQCWGPLAMRNPAGRKSECIHPGSQGPGATQVPNEGMKGCSADVTRWGSVA